MKRTVCFFAKVRDWKTLERVEFYAQDIRALRELGFDVRLAISPTHLVSADFYFVWWWTWALFPLAVATALRRPVLISGVFDFPSMSGRVWWHKKAITAALRLADTNVFVSHHDMAETMPHYEVTRPRLLPLAVDADEYRPAGPRESFVLSVGWLEGGNAVRKCMPEIVRAARVVQETHPGVRFLIGGLKGTYHPFLERLAEEIGATSVEFVGELSRAAKIDLMQRCLLYLQPSRVEGFGLAILEAMSCGAPVVTSPVGSVPEVVGDTAVLVNGTDAGAIASAVMELLGDEARLREMSLRSRQRAEKIFSYERRREALGRIIDDMLARRGTGTVSSGLPAPGPG